MRRVEDIAEAFAERREARAQLDADHAKIRRILDGDPSVFYEITAGVETASTPQATEVYVANMLLAGGEQIARRIAANPTIVELATKPLQRTAQRTAAIGAQVKNYWWRENKMALANRQVARWLLAYAEAPIVIWPDATRGIPCFSERDPLTAYPAETSTWHPDPGDIIFRYRRRVGDLRLHYPSAHAIDATDADEVEVLEYHDATEQVLACQGGRYRNSGWLELRRVANRAGVPLFVVPRGINFGSRQGAFNQLAGLLAAQARMTILMMMAAERQVFPDTFISGRVVSPAIAQGPDAVTILDEGASVTRLNYNSGFQFLQELDRFERQVRIGAGIPSQFAGETPSTLATGRGNQLLISATVDEGVRERQEILGEAYRLMLEKAVVMDQSGLLGNPNVARTFDTEAGDDGEAGVSSYIPARLTRGTTRVEYGLLAATDASQATVMLGQLVGTGLMSEEGAAEKHPFIDHPRLERRRVKNERIDRAILSALEQMAAATDPVSHLPLMDVRVLTKIKKAIAAGEDLEAAVADALGDEGSSTLPAAEAAGTAPAAPGGPAPPTATGRPSYQALLSRLTSGGAASAILQQQQQLGG